MGTAGAAKRFKEGGRKISKQFFNSAMNLIQHIHPLCHFLLNQPLLLAQPCHKGPEFFLINCKHSAHLEKIIPVIRLSGNRTTVESPFFARLTEDSRPISGKCGWFSLLLTPCLNSCIVFIKTVPKFRTLRHPEGAKCSHAGRDVCS